MNKYDFIDKAEQLLNTSKNLVSELEAMVSSLKENPMLPKPSDFCTKEWVRHEYLGYGCVLGVYQYGAGPKTTDVKFLDRRDPIGFHDTISLIPVKAVPWNQSYHPKDKFNCIIDGNKYVCSINHIATSNHPIVIGVCVWYYSDFVSFDYLFKRAVLEDGMPCGMFLDKE